jgi:DNA-binding LacI/PurR family transcriptional regulator
VTLNEIAQVMGVSRATVSNAYNHPDQLSEDLRRRILATARTMGYAGPDPAARSLRRGVAESIGVALTETLSYAFSDAAAISFLHGVARQTEAVGLSLLLIPATPLEHPGVVRDAIVDGFLVYSMRDDDAHVAAILERQLPAVFVDQPYVPQAHFVGIDNRSPSRQLAGHLLELGHRRLAVVAFPCDSDGYRGPADVARQERATRRVTRDRLSGYRDAVEGAGLEWPDVIVEERLRSDEGEGLDAGLAILRRDPRPTAILAMSDQLALGILQATRQLGLRVPQDVSVVGFDDIPSASLASPGLTTVRQPLARKGVLAADVLMRALGAASRLTPQVHTLPTRLVVRGSSGPVPGGAARPSARASR